jgi:TRAP-type uncharacterized transport system fused permease subunit
MFAFYFAILSAITPPVALAVYAAAGLAKANLWQAGWTAVRVGAAGFIVPFMFMFEPSLLMIGAWHEILQSFVTAAIGTVCLAGGPLRLSPAHRAAVGARLPLSARSSLIKPGPGHRSRRRRTRPPRDRQRSSRPRRTPAPVTTQPPAKLPG